MRTGRLSRVAPVAVGSVLLLGAGPAVDGAPGSGTGSTADVDGVPAGLTAGDWAGIREAYEVGRLAAFAVGGEYQARNPGQRWGTHFDGRGFTTAPDGGGWSWGLALARYGFSGMERTVQGRARVQVDGPRVAYAWDETLEEWYVNGRSGLEHGFTLRARPPRAPTSAGPLRIALTLRGGLEPEVFADGRGTRFVDAAGKAVVSYTGLAVRDREGRELPARMVAGSAALVLEVDEQKASYPLTIDPVAQQAYLKASNTDANDQFGLSVSIDGDTVVVGAQRESSSATGVNGNQADNSASLSGAVYVFVRIGTTWSQQAYLKASNTDQLDFFGDSVSIDGDTLVVGAYGEDSSATGVNGNQADNSANNSGAAYVFVRSGTTWSQQAYLKASNTGMIDQFGCSVTIDGDTVVVGAFLEDSGATGVNGNQAGNGAPDSGAAYVFVRSGTTWTQQAYLKASNTGGTDWFGYKVSISGDSVVVGALLEASSATGVNGNQADNSVGASGAAYVFVRSGTTWSQQAYLKASNTGLNDRFGNAVSISGDAAVVGAPGEASSATGVNGNQADDSAADSGAAYVFVRSGTTWSQQAYLKASNTDPSDHFGSAAWIDGDTVVVGATNEASSATGVNGNQADNSASDSGAAYVFVRSGTTWFQQAYLKGSNTEAGDSFSGADPSSARGTLSISMDTVVVGAPHEDSNATAVNGDQADNSLANAGAVYVFVLASGLSFANTILAAELGTDPVLADVGGDPTIGPRIGDPTEVFDLSLDCSNTTGPGVYTIALKTGHFASAVPTTSGFLWANGSTLAKQSGAHSQNVVTWGATVLPGNMALVGLEYTTQGFCSGGGVIRLSNAIVQRIGSP